MNASIRVFNRVSSRSSSSVRVIRFLGKHGWKWMTLPAANIWLRHELLALHAERGNFNPPSQSEEEPLHLRAQHEVRARVRSQDTRNRAGCTQVG
jgi:hypothetical protein